MARSKSGSFFLFIGFVIVAAVLWFLFRYNNTYEQYTEVAVEWSNVPVDVELADNARQVRVPVKIKASGFQLLWLNYEDVVTVLDFQDYIKVNDDVLVFAPESARNAIDRSLGDGVDLMEVETASIKLGYQRFASKSVSLFKNFKLNFSGNYQQLGKGEFSVEKVKITGNDELIASIDSLDVKLDDIIVKDSVVNYEIDLNKLFPKIRMEPRIVTYTIRAAQMTEGSFKLPITLENKPDNATVQVIPDVVNVVYSCRLVDYDGIEKKDFEVVIDIQTLSNGETTAVPRLIFDNPKVNEARVQPQSVQILVIQ